jgi:hypothetical protein
MERKANGLEKFIHAKSGLAPKATAATGKIVLQIAGLS